ncbi:MULTISPECIES: DUF1396 domain-containing protein [unclassified Streptomyces]|uniref:DUF1396 domain-containing protein n=1 Tax=unclassified Streptomyces TaxID=2593676 RepID=UPI002E0E2B6A|nr:DUF1396 domain-containing protein [Streptomyces sp. NBC_01236]
MGFSVDAAVRRRAAGVTLAVLVLGGGGVACTKSDAGESPKMSPAAAVARAAKNADDITSLRYRMSGRVPEEGRVGGEGALSLKPPAMSLRTAALDGPDKGKSVEMRLVDGVLYMGGGAEPVGGTDGKHWMKFDLSGHSRTSGGMTFDTTKWRDETGKNPAQEAGFLAGSKDVKKVGTEKVDGVRTTHYKGTVTLDAIRADLKTKDKAVRERREKNLKQYEEMGADKLTMDLWIGPDDHTKQFRVRAAADKGPFDVTMTFLDYNKPVTIKAPAAKDTVDLAKAMKDAQKG